MAMTASGPGTFGAIASNGATVTISGGSLDVTGAPSAGTVNGRAAGAVAFPNSSPGTGLLAIGGNASITAGGGLQITMPNVGAWAMTGTPGAYAGPASIALDGVDITQVIPTGASAYTGGLGLRADGLGSSIKANKTSATMFGDNSSAVFATYGATIGLTNSAFETHGNGTAESMPVIDALGQATDGTPARITAANVTATSYGDYAMGVSSLSGAAVTLNGVNITTYGLGSVGMDAQGYLSFGTAPTTTSIIGTTSISSRTETGPQPLPPPKPIPLTACGPRPGPRSISPILPSAWQGIRPEASFRIGNPQPP